MSLCIGRTELRLRIGFFLALGAFSYLAPTSTAGLMLLAVLIHELGHIAAMLLCGVRLIYVGIGPFGACMRTERGRIITYPRELFVYLSGPLMGLISAGTAFLIWGDGAADFIMASLGLSAFNLLPAETLDGGSIVYLAISSRWGPVTAGRWLRALTFVIMPPLFILAFLLLFSHEPNISLLITCTYLALIALLR